MGIFRGEGGTGDSNTDATVTAVTEQATIATTKASEAAASASEASTSAANSAASASSSSNSSAAAATSATQAATSATASAASATASASSATSAATAQANAETAETNAETAETNAAASATTATTKASEAATSATSASTSASTATTKASEAATSASNAATSETNAATSASTATTKASEASTSASNAATSEANAAASYDDFDDRYLGAKSSAPSTDNDGDALVTGALYFDTSSNAMKVWSGSAWLDAYASLSGALIATNNLSDLNNAGTARTNLGLGTAATTASTDYATAAQGTTADNALPKSGGAMTGAITTNSTFDGRDVSADGTKLDGIEAGATADQTAAEIKTAYESNADTNAFTDADHTKLDGIEASADVTDTANVTAALSAGTGISLSVGGVIANTSPDQTVSLTGGTGISTSGTYPNFTITNDSPDQTVSLTGAGATSISGTYPNFTITSTDNNTTYTAGTGITLTGTEFSIGQPVATTDSPTFAGLTVDTDTLYVDSTNNRVGIGTTSPSRTLHLKEAVPCIRLEDTDVSGVYHEMISEANTGYCIRVDEGNVASGSYFRVDIDNSEKMRIDSSGNVGIGTTSPASTLEIAKNDQTNGATLSITNSFNGGSWNAGDIVGSIDFRTDDTSTTEPVRGQIKVFDDASGGANTYPYASAMSFTTTLSNTSTERMRIDSAGLVTMTGNGCDIKWSANSNTTKARFINEEGVNDTWVGIGGYNGVNRLESGYGFSGGSADLMVYGGIAGELARITTDKKIGINVSNPTFILEGSRYSGSTSSLDLFKISGQYGGIQARSFYATAFIGQSSTAGHGIGLTGDSMYPAEADNYAYYNDNAMDCGRSNARWDDVYATNGTIQTSDEREKQDIETLSDAEQRVAVAAKGLLRKYRWKDSVEEKGDNARTHFGIIAQDLQAAFVAEGLDPSDYAMFIKSEWWIGNKTYPAVDEVLDDEGNVVVEGAPEQTETNHQYDNEADAPSDATYHYRLGIRYSELLAFIISAI